MQRFQLPKTIAVSLACCGLLLPQAELLAAGPTANNVRAKTALSESLDVAMNLQGTIIGRVVDSQGNALDGAAVTLIQGRKKVATTVADKHGEFVVRNLPSGVYHVFAGNGHQVIRCWAANTAPPSAKQRFVLVSGAPVVRAQGCCGLDAVTLAALGLTLASVTLTAIVLDKVDDLENEVDKIPKS